MMTIRFHQSVAEFNHISRAPIQETHCHCLQHNLILENSNILNTYILIALSNFYDFRIFDIIHTLEAIKFPLQ